MAGKGVNSKYFNQTNTTDYMPGGGYLFAYSRWLRVLEQMYCTPFEWVGDFPSEIGGVRLEKLGARSPLLMAYDEIIDYWFLLPLGSPLYRNFYNEPIVYVSPGFDGRGHYVAAEMVAFNSDMPATNYIQEPYFKSVRFDDTLLEVPAFISLQHYARRLAALDVAIESNLNMQKTPIVAMGTQDEQLTLINVLKQLEIGKDVIRTDQDFDMGSLQTLDLRVDFKGLDFQSLQRSTLNEWYTFSGYFAHETTKKERSITGEIGGSVGETRSNRDVRMIPRKNFCEHVRKYLGRDFDVEYRGLDIEEISLGVFGNDVLITPEVSANGQD